MSLNIWKSRCDSVVFELTSWKDVRYKRKQLSNKGIGPWIDYYTSPWALTALTSEKCLLQGR